ncbi:MAG: N(4)-(beta-N-acetylglucosaminyl)-L-asparaginase [Bacteroidota bacterium]
MFSRRRFLYKSLLGSLVLGTGCRGLDGKDSNALDREVAKSDPLVLSTWKNEEANLRAWEILAAGGKAVDAVEQGVRVTEANPKDKSVGYGGLPDRDGRVTLDACIMDEVGNCGSVSYLQHIKHPVSVARKVMDETPHVMLAGDGALQFALSKGFKKENLLTEKSRKEWEAWKKEAQYQPIINIENHDTIGMLAIDQKGNISGACTTSGLAFKMNGRVGDSPIIGAGLYIDNEVGGATATGMGEAVLKSLGSFLVVELMRQGKSPMDACKEAVMRIVRRQPDYKKFQVGYLAVNKDGVVGAYCIQPGFIYGLCREGKNKLLNGQSYITK